MTTTSNRTGSVGDRFLADLAARGVEPLLKHASGTIRIDLVDGGRVEHRLISIDHGHVAVSSQDGEADATLVVSPEVFDGMAAGRVNAVAAMLRGDLVVEGDLGLLVLFQRVFPSPPRAEAGAATTGGTTS